MKTKLHSNLYLTSAVFIALFLFTVGRFGFFDILGLKRMVEIVLILPLAILAILLALVHSRKYFNPFLLLPLSYLLVLLSWNGDMLQLADLTATMVVVIIILSLGQDFSELLLTFVIKIATFFACMGLIEFVILLFDPSLVNHILLFYDNYSGSSVPVIENFFQLLGLADGTSYHLWGMSVTRLRSFTSEPSLLVGYFLVPGALALTLNGKYKACGAICILFCLCSLSGSVFVSLLLALFVYILSFFRNRQILIIFPFIILITFIWILNNYYSELIGLNKISGGSYDFLDKTNSANIRFSYIRDYASIIFSSVFGLRQEIQQPLGLLLSSMARGGILGFLFIVVVLFKLFTRLTKHLVTIKHSHLEKIGFAIIYGALTAGILYLDNCFIQLYGFTILLIIYNRLDQRA